MLLCKFVRFEARVSVNIDYRRIIQFYEISVNQHSICLSVFYYSISRIIYK